MLNLRGAQVLLIKSFIVWINVGRLAPTDQRKTARLIQKPTARWATSRAALRRRKRKKTTHNWVRFGYAFTASHSSLWQFVPAKTRRKPTVLTLNITLSRRRPRVRVPSLPPFTHISSPKVSYIHRHLAQVYAYGLAIAKVTSPVTCGVDTACVGPKSRLARDINFCRSA